MGNMYIIKSGDQRFRYNGSSYSSAPCFSANISLNTAHKMVKRSTAERLIAERISVTTDLVHGLERMKPDHGHGSWYTAERIASELERTRQTLALWRAARVVEVGLVVAA